MNLTEFNEILNSLSSTDELYDYCRKYVLHGVPYVFEGNDEKFYEFRKRIAKNFQIPYHEIYVTGSGKLGFSPFKNKQFDLDSDIDVAIISPFLFEKIMKSISSYQMSFRANRRTVRERELLMYHDFLEYVALGWIRPDKLPTSFQMNAFKNNWFDFFNSISYGRSEVGDYKVNAGVFKSYEHLEDYIVNGLNNIKRRKIVRK